MPGKWRPDGGTLSPPVVHSCRGRLPRIPGCCTTISGGIPQLRPSCRPRPGHSSVSGSIWVNLGVGLTSARICLYISTVNGTIFHLILSQLRILSTPLFSDQKKIFFIILFFFIMSLTYLIFLLKLKKKSA